MVYTYDLPNQEAVTATEAIVITEVLQHNCRFLDVKNTKMIELMNIKLCKTTGSLARVLFGRE